MNKFGIDSNGKFYVEIIPCSRPIGNVRQEMEAACTNLASQGDIMIHLSGGLDSQVLVHTFHTLGLPYQAAFLYHPGVNEKEFAQVQVLEKKYGFKCVTITMDPAQHREWAEQQALNTKIPPEHWLMYKFTEQLPNDVDILQGIDSPDLVFRSNGSCYCLEAWNTIALARIRALEQLDRKGRIVTIDRRAPFSEFALAYLSDPIVDAYIHTITYTFGNGLVEKSSGKPVPMPFNWEYFVKPLIFGTHWKNELEYFPKYSSQTQIDWLASPANPALRHNYSAQRVFIERNQLIAHLQQWGSTKILRQEEYDGTIENTQPLHQS